MGYYATAFEGIINIPQENNGKATEAITTAITELNKVRPNYWQEPTRGSVEEYLTDSSFEFSQEDNGDILVYGFDAKWREHETLLNALADLVTPNSRMAFRGEDGEMWLWTPRGVFAGKVCWEV